MLQNPIQLLKKFTHSLSFKFSFYAGLIMFLALLAFTYHTITTQERNTIDRMIQTALKDSEVIKAAIWEGMMTKDRRVIREIIKSIGAQAAFREINIYDRQGTLHYSSHSQTTESNVGQQPEPL
ncbi:MAG TPA: hypothetical protein VMC85_16630, partial [Desulfomonilaceae bacterium]|nr:hypothetical protein [Desulfomonilaceae bacterium]